MASVTGARGTGNVLSTQRKPDIANAVRHLEPDAAPLTVLTRQLPKKPTINPEFGWFEKELENRYDAINNGAGYASGATSIVVDDGTKFAQHYIVQVTRTGENMRVTAVSTNTLTVVRGVGSTAAAINDNDEVVVIGIAQPEGDTSRPARSSNPTKIINYTQIVREPFEVTGTHMHSDQFTSPHDWDEEAAVHRIEHEKDLELSFWHGRPSEDTSGSQPRRTTGGVFHFADENITDAGGTLTEAEFFGALRPAFRYGAKTKVAFGGSLVVDVLNAYPRGKLQTEQGETTYGLNVMTYISPHGRLRLVTHYLLEGSKYSGYLAILDMNQIRYRHLSNQKGSRDTHRRDNIQAADADTRKDEYLTEAGLEFGNPKAHALITGVTG